MLISTPFRYKFSSVIWPSVMFPIRILFLLSFSASLFSSIDNLQILGILPFTSTSHFNIGSSIIKALNEAGHSVTVMSPYPRKHTKENYTDIDGSSILEGFKKGLFIQQCLWSM